jgi:acetoin utilization deacetylase AcuC-like enzyme
MFQDVREELLSDAALVHRAITFTVDQQSSCTTTTVVYLIPTHPGHHAARDSFGGYCYLNHAAAIAQSSSTRQAGMQRKKIAILDVDYHCGNGTASIFYDDPSVLVVSIHCDPNHEYPFHSGYEHQTGVDKGKNTTLHIPLPPGTGWSEYRVALEKGLAAIQEFGAEMVVISLGLDTYDKDPCAIRRAGFHLRGFDYVEMGETIAKGLARTVPVVFVQEGGYRMDKIGEAAADVVASFCEHRS